MKGILTLLALLIGSTVFGQELNCQVQVIKPTVQTTNEQIFEDLQRSIFEFMNNKKWTNAVFSTEERIECGILINVSDFQNGSWKADIQITSSRTVFKTSYKSTVLNINDKNFDFSYLQNTPIEFFPDQHKSNLASVLAFYAYIIIGSDFDTYAFEGGTPYFTKAQQVVNNAQNAGSSGWRASEGTSNRYWLIDNILHQRFKPMRECAYKYHRLGFDKMYDEPEGGRAQITQALELLKKVHQARPASYNMQLFFTAKRDEIVNLYGEAFPQEKTRIFNLLKTIDASNVGKYQKIMTGK